VSDSPALIRSYQRIFRPERRLYQIDGRRLPVPGGVPLQWLGWAFASLVGVLVLSERSIAFALLLAVIGGVLGASQHGLGGALLLAAAGFAGTLLAGVVLGWIDWPLRLLILPGLLATVAGHPSSDGRSTHRYLVSWLAVGLRAARRSLDRPLTADGESEVWAPRVWVAPDHHSPILQTGRVHGPARLVFARRVVVSPARGRLVVRAAEGHRMRRGERVAEVIELGDGQILEVRR
jgi:TcpE family